MTEEEKLYRRLQRHLYRMPGAFSEVESVLDIKLMKQFFTSEEAEIATQLSMKPEPLSRVFNRLKHKGILL